jgi:hypothetical protein
LIDKGWTEFYITGCYVEAWNMGKEGFYHKPYGETSGSGKSFNLDKPVDLVGNMRALVNQARGERRRGEFNAPLWLRGQIDSLFRSKSASKIAPREIAALALDLRTAWDVVAYNAYPQDEDSRNSINLHLRQYVLIHHTNSVTLTDQLAVQFLDAMAEATDIPHTSGETTFDLTPFKNLYGY